MTTQERNESIREQDRILRDMERIDTIRGFAEQAFCLMEDISSLAADLEEAHLKAYARRLDTASSILNLLSERLTDKARDLEGKS